MRRRTRDPPRESGQPESPVGVPLRSMSLPARSAPPFEPGGAPAGCCLGSSKPILRRREPARAQRQLDSPGTQTVSSRPELALSSLAGPKRTRAGARPSQEINDDLPPRFDVAPTGAAAPPRGSRRHPRGRESMVACSSRACRYRPGGVWWFRSHSGGASMVRVRPRHGTQRTAVGRPFRNPAPARTVSGRPMTTPRSW